MANDEFLQVQPIVKRGRPPGRVRFTPREVTINGRTYWQVATRSYTDGDGRRVVPRKTFRSKAEAIAYARLKRIERENRGILSVSLDERARADVVEARKLLDPYPGVSILDAVRDYVARAALLTRSVTVKVAVAECLAAKKSDRLRKRYQGALRVALERFKRDFGERTMAEITAAEIDAWLRSLMVAPVTRNSTRLRLSALFSYAKDRGWIATNPVLEIKKLRTGDTLPGILTPDQVARLLEAASSATLPYWAIGAFAGLRSAELERLAWRDIHFDEKVIEVPARTSKTASRRFVTLRPNLLEWLKPYRRMQGELCPTNLRKRLEADRKAAGLLQNWPTNCLRHSFASYALARWKDAAATALELGHIRPDVTFRHYHQRVRKSEAIRYWKIVPVEKTTTVTTMAAA
jgi:integrase